MVFYQSDGIRQFALESGVGDPPLVFVHGNGSVHSAWHHQIAEFSKTRRVVALDVRGHGETGRALDGDYGQEALYRDLAACLDAVAAERAVLVGWSVGALMATRYAVRHASRVAAVVLVDNSPAGDQIGLDPTQLANTIRLLDTDFEGAGVRSYIDQWFPEQGLEIIRLKEWCYEVCRRTGQEVVHGIRAAGAAPDRLDLLRQLRVPTLICQGGASSLGGRPMGEYLASIVEPGRLYVFEGKGHAIPLTAPDEFNSVLRQFVDEVAPVR